MDTKSKEERSKNMAAVKNKNTDLEIRLRKALWQQGLRYRLSNKLPGRPDIIFPGKKIAVFCDGCFWHGCPKCGQIPEQNRVFWVTKIKKNRLNDMKVTQKLEQLGWKVKRYWGCEIKKELERVVNDIKQTINGGD
ncbi:very short patch repair endonuclease [Desulforamulus hydrothermalis]|uniref:Very short patch repair endonuclease n=1 Tax=Desulforamulus hydrothermalis Lam5 = DSM 18033 TaxID=1121428 RepID=K8EHE2_9FIRM|nr:very short patch repair endonuclease [Desulforamulus hydrothermalis]CCO08061.1 putative NmeDIP very short patch repair endonuclease [Desulforamulus hydrothermalis Lam5 = DSM 18033]SHG82976.1 T/G mismatch-specific endonuclease [Desulforamulus hydrothermalis Lam5 = DSM 18033]